jgi:alkylation response protein AidB-like acyl-CoA dehydrogenase
MDFSLSQEQQLLADSARRYVREQYTFEQRRKILASADGYSRATWKDFADLGLLALNVPERDGGLGGGPVETMLLGMAVGEGLVVEPYLSSAVVATRAIALLGSPAQRAQWLAPLAAGELIAIPVLDTAYGPRPAEPVRATRRGDAWELNGQAPVVYHAPAADLLLVAASSEAAGGEPDVLLAVPAATSGVRRTGLSTVDGQVAADIDFRAVAVGTASRIGGDVRAEVPKIVDYGLFALCAEALGALDRCLELTVEYTRTRHQFGGPIGRFQALQHRMVDMLTRVEQARSLVYLAASRCEDGDAQLRESALSAAKVLVCEAARFVGQQAVQLHGGMGVSDEVSISHYFKRLLAIELRFGSAAAHLDRYSRHLAAE